MKEFRTGVLIIIFFCSCRTTAIIEGNVTGLPSNAVYLFGSSINSRPIDSAEVTDNKFSFTKKVGKKDAPRLVRLQPKNFHGYDESPFFLYNDKDSLDQTHVVRNLIYLEKGETIISGNYKNRYLTVRSGKDNDLQFYDTSPSEFLLWDEQTDSASRQADLKKAEEFIRANPNSFYFLDKIISAKVDFRAAELQQLLSLFDKKIQRTQKAKELQAYSNYKLKTISSYSNFKLPDSTNHLADILDSNAQITIISFWASWCVPCRTEIPMLKRIYEQYHNKGLRVISISTEKSEQDWKRALIALQMPWAQYKIPEQERDKRILEFDAYSIPETIILSKDFKIIEKNVGFDSETEKKYQLLLAKLF